MNEKINQKIKEMEAILESFPKQVKKNVKRNRLVEVFDLCVIIFVYASAVTGVASFLTFLALQFNILKL